MSKLRSRLPLFRRLLRFASQVSVSNLSTTHAFEYCSGPLGFTQKITHERAFHGSWPVSEIHCQNKATISAMYPFRLLLGPALGHRLCFLASFLYLGFLSNAAPSLLNSPYCDGVYGFPLYSDCTKVLSRLPQDEIVHFFVEQQLRSAAPQADWPPFEDPRLRKYQQAVVQIPKWWSHGEDAFISPRDRLECVIAVRHYTKILR